MTITLNSRTFLAFVEPFNMVTTRSRSAPKAAIGEWSSPFPSLPRLTLALAAPRPAARSKRSAQSASSLGPGGLPNELLGQIVTEVGLIKNLPDRRRACSALCITSRALLPLARAELYREVQVKLLCQHDLDAVDPDDYEYLDETDYELETNAYELASSLRKNHLAPLVKKLVVSVEVPWHVPHSYIDDMIQFGAMEEGLSDVLELCADLKELHLNFGLNEEANSRLSYRLGDHLEANSITSLHLSTWSDSWFLLSRLPALKTLTLGQAPTTCPSTLPFKASLDSLTIRTSSSTYLKHITANSHASLRHLYTSTFSLNDPLIPPAFFTSLSNLTSLELWTCKSGPTSAIGPSLQACTAMQRLKITGKHPVSLDFVPLLPSSLIYIDLSGAIIDAEAIVKGADSWGKLKVERAVLPWSRWSEQEAAEVDETLEKAVLRAWMRL